MKRSPAIENRPTPVVSAAFARQEDRCRDLPNQEEGYYYVYFQGSRLRTMMTFGITRCGLMRFDAYAD